MSTVRLILLAIFALLVLTALGMSVNSMRQGPGDGEVGVILHGVFIIAGLGLALFFALAAIATAFWHRKRVRIVALCGIGIMALVPVVGWGQHQIKLNGWEADTKRKQAGATELVALYDTRLAQAPLEREILVQLRRDLDRDMLRQRFFWSAGGIKDWYVMHSLVTAIFVDPSYDPATEFSVLDFPSTTACDAFLVRYPNALDTAARKAIFRRHCPHTPIN